jgi:hypothetical protein
LTEFYLMGLRGPKPVDSPSLVLEASIWANILFALRDGVDGWAAEVRWKQQITDLAGGPVAYWSGQTLARRPLKSATFPAGMSNAALRKFQRAEEGWQYVPPISPDATIWNRLKESHAVREVQAAGCDFRKWTSRWRKGYMIVKGKKFSQSLLSANKEHRRMFEVHAGRILAAKKLWAYPLGNRSRSDDKRIEFFCKVLAGLMLEIAPTTAIHRLTGWHWPKQTIKQ